MPWRNPKEVFVFSFKLTNLTILPLSFLISCRLLLFHKMHHKTFHSKTKSKDGKALTWKKCSIRKNFNPLYWVRYNRKLGYLLSKHEQQKSISLKYGKHSTKTDLFVTQETYYLFFLFKVKVDLCRAHSTMQCRLWSK